MISFSGNKYISVFDHRIGEWRRIAPCVKNNPLARYYDELEQYPCSAEIAGVKQKGWIPFFSVLIDFVIAMVVAGIIFFTLKRIDAEIFDKIWLYLKGLF